MPASRLRKKIGVCAASLGLALLLVSPLMPSRHTQNLPSPLPPKPLYKVRIVIDPGHGGVDGGCCYKTNMEKHLNLAVAKALQLELEQLGAQVKLTRTSDVALAAYDGVPGRHRRDLAARIKIAREYSANLLISLHANTGPSRLSGSLTFYRQGDDESRRLAGLVQESMSQLIPGNQNGILPAKFAVLVGVDMPAILIELGFLSNATDRERLLRPGAAFPLAAGIAQGVLAYIQGSDAVTPTISPYPVPDGDEPYHESECINADGE